MKYKKEIEGEIEEIVIMLGNYVGSNFINIEEFFIYTEKVKKLGEEFKYNDGLRKADRKSGLENKINYKNFYYDKVETLYIEINDLTKNK